MNNSIFNILQGGVKHGYRSDIDGLRAIACLAVVIFHAFPNYLKGGFVGVDIFFVISGFLISSILYRNLFNTDAPGRVNIVDFYIRRVRRIFPALLAVLITTLILGWFVLLPEEYKLLGKHTLGGATYINNFMLYKESGDYFNAASNAKPLLHLWSLGVEEQFYLIFPIILWLVYKTNLNFVLCLTVFTVISFALNRNGVNHNHQTVAFYLPWCRFWELSIGAILAYTVNYHKELVEKVKTLITDNVVADTISKFIFRNSNDDLRRNLINNLISIAGLVTIIYGIATINNDITFPGTKALIPVFGALMIIGAGKTAVINKYVLSNRAMVFLGLISYPLYLWHWPLLSLAYICEGQMPTALIRAGAVVIAVVLATFTYFVIEPPLRYGTHSKTKAVGLFITLLVVGYFGHIIENKNGFKDRFNNENYFETDIKEFNSYNDSGYNKCLEKYPEWGQDGREGANECVIHYNGSKGNIFLVGDSHAAQIEFGLWRLIKNTNELGITKFVNNSNTPYFDVLTTHWPYYNDLILRRVPIRNKAIFDSFRESKNTIYILDHAPGGGFNENNVVGSGFQDLNGNMIKYSSRYELNKKAAEDTFEVYRKYNKKVLFILTNPRSPISPTSCHGRPFSLTTIKTCKFKREYYDNDPVYYQYNKAIRDAAKNFSNVELFDFSDYMCDTQYCYLEKNGNVLYRPDKFHLNEFGSVWIAPYLYKKIESMLKSDFRQLY